MSTVPVPFQFRSSSVPVPFNMSASAIATILDVKNIPTINQLKKTNAFKQGNHAFKNISLSMFNHMTGLKKDSTNQKKTKSIVNSVLIGYNSEKAKNILISIAREAYENIQKKEENKKI